LLGSARPPTEVIALNDRVVIGVYQAAAAVGMTIPDDVSVIHQLGPMPHPTAPLRRRER